MQSEIGELLGVRFIHSQQVMAGCAVVVDALAAVLRVLAAIVAAKASWIVVVSKVVRVRTPRDFHEREHILAIDCAESLRESGQTIRTDAPSSTHPS